MSEFLFFQKRKIGLCLQKHTLQIKTNRLKNYHLEGFTVSDSFVPTQNKKF